MRKILFCFMALLLVMMIALIASAGFAQPSETEIPYIVWDRPSDIQVAAGIAAVGILTTILAISIDALCSMFYLYVEHMSSMSVKAYFRTILKTAIRRHDRHFRSALSWRTPLIKPIVA